MYVPFPLSTSPASASRLTTSTHHLTAPLTTDDIQLTTPVLALASFFSAIAMFILAGTLLTYLSPDAVTFAFGIWYIAFAALLLLFGLAVLLIKYGPSCFSGTERRTIPLTYDLQRFWQKIFTPSFRRLTRLFSRTGDHEPTGFERGIRNRQARIYPWNPNRSSTLGYPYPNPRLEVMPTGLPSHWDRPDNVLPFRLALATMHPNLPIHVTPPTENGPIRVTPSVLESGPTADRGTQTNTRSVGGLGSRRGVGPSGFRVDERMPGGMSPMTFWWRLLEDQREKELEREGRGGRRYSW